MAAVPLVAHSGYLVAGCTGSGKSTWMKRLLTHVNDMFDETPSRTMYCYTVYQPLFDEMISVIPSLTFHRGLPSQQTIKDFAQDASHTILILDDLADKVVQSQEMTDLFTKFNHHLGISTFFLVQNLYTQGKHARTIYLNCHYIILFKSLRDKGQIALMGRQILGNRSRSMVEAYDDCMKTPYNYLVVDISPHTDDRFRLRSAVFPEEETVVYIPKP